MPTHGLSIHRTGLIQSTNDPQTPFEVIPAVAPFTIRMVEDKDGLRLVCRFDDDPDLVLEFKSKMEYTRKEYFDPDLRSEIEAGMYSELFCIMELAAVRCDFTYVVTLTSDEERFECIGQILGQLGFKERS